MSIRLYSIKVTEDAKKQEDHPQSVDIDKAFECVVREIGSDLQCIWNSVDVHQIYVSHEGCRLALTLILSGKGIASLTYFAAEQLSLLG